MATQGTSMNKPVEAVVEAVRAFLENNPTNQYDSIWNKVRTQVMGTTALGAAFYIAGWLLTPQVSILPIIFKMTSAVKMTGKLLTLGAVGVGAGAKLADHMQQRRIEGKSPFAPVQAADGGSSTSQL